MEDIANAARILVRGNGEGEVLACAEGLSFWGGVDPDTGLIVDSHHPNRGESVAGKVLLMETSRGSCSGSSVLLQLALSGLAPAALVFRGDEEVLTLGALVCDRVFDVPVPALRLPGEAFDALRRSRTAAVAANRLTADGLDMELAANAPDGLRLSGRDREILDGSAGPAARLAMEVICLMAAARGAEGLVDVTRAHIDGCILAHSANLIFAEKMAELGAEVAIPTTTNAISVDRDNWRSQGVAAEFGERASRLADAYVRMGARPVFTCAPYLLDDAPEPGESIGWSESNAVIFANSVLGARTAKHPDYMDLFIAMTGRAPAVGAYAREGRVPRRIVEVEAPGAGADDALWPLLGWLAGRLSPDRVPLLAGLEGLSPSRDDLKALCAAFGTTSGSAMLHVAGHTPEADLAPAPDADRRTLARSDIEAAWNELNRGIREIDLVAVGSPHASLPEIRRIADLFDGRRCGSDTDMIVTVGRDVLRQARSDGALGRLEQAGARIVPDLCWCSITEPVFPPGAKGLMTNSGKYAHYAHGISGRHARFGSLADCVEAAVTGKAPDGPPDWLRG